MPETTESRFADGGAPGGEGTPPTRALPTGPVGSSPAGLSGLLAPLVLVVLGVAVALARRR